MHAIEWLGFALGALATSSTVCMADGVSVFRWNKKIDIDEPTQKAILLHDNGREDLVLQVKYEGPAEEFGWLVPVPGRPKVRQGSMDCFYELSQLTQRQSNVRYLSLRGGPDDDVKVIKTETIGAYNVTILAAGDAGKLAAWLETNGFVFPKKNQGLLDGYIKKQWSFVVVKVDPRQIGAGVRQELAAGELHPLVFSFDSEECVFPLAISAANGVPSEVSLYVLSADPLASRTMIDKQFAANSKVQEAWVKNFPERRQAMQKAKDNRDRRMDLLLKRNASNPDYVRQYQPGYDPADPPPPASTQRALRGDWPPPLEESPGDGYPGGQLLLTGMEVKQKDLAACAKELPRLAGKSWWLCKQVQTFTPAEMRDLEFEPAIPLLTEVIHRPGGVNDGFDCLNQFGSLAVPVVLASMKSPDPAERRLACNAAGQLKDARLGKAAAPLLSDENLVVRRAACWAIENNWDEAYATRLVEMLNDPDEQIRRGAMFILRRHPSETRTPIYRQMLASDSVAAGQAVLLAGVEDYSRADLVRLLASTNLPVVSMAYTMLQRIQYSLTEKDIATLLANPLPKARLIGLGALRKIGDKPAVDRIVSMLRDPNEVVAYKARAALRQATGQNLGADPAAYEKWWKENRETFAQQ